MPEGPRLTTTVFELLDGTRANSLEANSRFKEITQELEEQLQDRSHFEDFVWPGVGRKNPSPYTSRQNKQSGDYWKFCWLGIAHRVYREEYERPQDGPQLQFITSSKWNLTSAGISLHLNSSAPDDIKSGVRENLQSKKDQFIQQIDSLDEYKVVVGEDVWTTEKINSEWDVFLNSLDDHLNIIYPLTEDEVEALGESLVATIVNSFEDLLPLYGLISGVQVDQPPYSPSVWIEKTAVEDRDYKQEGELALGNAIWSPQRDEGGGDRYRLMRHVQPEDLIIHYVKDDGAFVGVSTVDSTLIDDFVCPPDSQWGYEDDDRPGYRINLRDFQEFESSLVVSAILDNEEYHDTLDELREEYSHLFYSRREDGFRPGEGGYLSRVPDAFAEVLSNESRELREQLANRGYPLTHPIMSVSELGEEVLTDFENEEFRPELYRVALSHLLAGKNVVFYGPPGTGKTRAARKLSEEVCSEIQLETANAEWTNYEVVGGPRPADDGGWIVEPGFFTEAAQQCADRLVSQNRPHWLIIDELNRANLDEAFGEVFTLLDLDYRTDNPLEIEETYVPLSFRLLATMNTYDKAQLFTLGYAFMRRFAFIQVPSLITGTDDIDRVSIDETVDITTLSLTSETQATKAIIKKSVVDHFQGNLYETKVELDTPLLFPELDEPLNDTKLSDDLLTDTRLQTGGYDFIEALLLFSQEITNRDIVEIGQALVIDAAKYVVAYSLLFPDRRSTDVIDEAIVAYLLPQFDFYMPKLRKATTLGGDTDAEEKLDQIIALAQELEFWETARQLQDAKQGMRVIG